MSFWNYLGLAALLNMAFGRKSRPNFNQYSQSADARRLLDREEELDARFDRLSDRIDNLEKRLADLDPDSEIYEDFEDQIEDLRDQLDDLEDERNDLDDEFFEDFEDW